MRLWLLHTLSLIAAAAGTIATLKLIQVPINLLNVLAFPLMLGVGVDYGTHIILAAREQGDALGNISDVLKPIALSGLTTATGFGALILAQNPALSGLGTICAIGVAWCLLASLLIVTPGTVILASKAMTAVFLIGSRTLSDLHSNEAPARNAIMKMVIRVLLCLAVASISCVRADDVILSAQKKLKQLGFYDGVVDGQMGSQTAAAIRRFQIAEKLKVTGEMNSQTLRRLGISAPRARVPHESPRAGAGICRSCRFVQRRAFHLGRARDANRRHSSGPEEPAIAWILQRPDRWIAESVARCVPQSMASERRFSPNGAIR